MKFVYTPTGAEPKSWDFDARKMPNHEVEAIEDATGLAFNEWDAALGNASAKALHGLLWVLLKRDIPTLKYDQVSFSLGQVDFELDDDESRRLRDRLEERVAAGEDLDAQELHGLEVLRAQDLGPVKAAPGPKAPAKKAAARPSGGAGSGSSPTA